MWGDGYRRRIQAKHVQVRARRRDAHCIQTCAMHTSGAVTKKATVEKALRLLLQTHAQTSIRRLRGKVIWEGDLRRSRLDSLSD